MAHQCGPRIRGIIGDRHGASVLERGRHGRCARSQQSRGPGGSEQHFYTVGSLEDAFAEFAEAYGRTSEEPISLSGDLAADRVAPWRRPETLLVYTPNPFPAGEISLVEAVGPDDANVIIRNPADRSLFGVDSISSDGLRLVDPTQIIWDLLNQGGSDRQEAADKVTAWLLFSSATRSE